MWLCRLVLESLMLSSPLQPSCLQGVTSGAPVVGARPGAPARNDSLAVLLSPALPAPAPPLEKLRLWWVFYGLVE